MPNDVLDSGFGHWLAGFMDGEGCFSIQEQRNRGYGQTLHYVCKARVTLRGDDAAILYEISERTGIGTVLSQHCSNVNPKATWEVSRKAECVALIAILDRYPLRAKKAADYELWRQAVFAWMEIRRGGAPGTRGQVQHDWSEIRDLRARLMASREYVHA